MAQKKQQADERLQLMAETMHRRDLDVDKRIVDLMTTVHVLTLGVKGGSGDCTKLSFTCAGGTKPCEYTIYRHISTSTTHLKKVFQRQSGTKPDQMKQPKFHFRRITISS